MMWKHFICFYFFWVLVVSNVVSVPLLLDVAVFLCVLLASMLLIIFEIITLFLLYSRWHVLHVPIQLNRRVLPFEKETNQPSHSDTIIGKLFAVQSGNSLDFCFIQTPTSSIQLHSPFCRFWSLVVCYTTTFLIFSTESPSRVYELCLKILFCFSIRFVLFCYSVLGGGNVRKRWPEKTFGEMVLTCAGVGDCVQDDCDGGDDDVSHNQIIYLFISCVPFHFNSLHYSVRFCRKGHSRWPTRVCGQRI